MNDIEMKRLEQDCENLDEKSIDAFIKETESESEISISETVFNSTAVVLISIVLILVILSY